MADLNIIQIYEILGRKQVMPGIYILNRMLPPLCATIPDTCDELLWALCGPSKDLNASRFQVYVSETPADTSVKNMIQWMQGIIGDKFQMFDYGNASMNVKHYGANYSYPPQYDLSKVTFPTGLYSGKDDWMADVVDVDRLRDELPNGTVVQDIDVDGFDHMDFVWGIHANVKVYLKPNLLSQIIKYLG
eukprot:928201_1